MAPRPVAASAPLASGPARGEWDLSPTSERARAGARAERRRTIRRTGVPYGALTAVVVVVGVFAVRAGPSLLTDWVLALLVFCGVLGIAFSYSLRLHAETIRRPLGARLELAPDRVRVVGEPAGGSRVYEAPLEAGRVFVSPPGLNPPLRLPDGGYRPRAFLRVEPESGAPIAVPVPDEAARSIHRAMAARAAAGIGYDEGRNPFTRVWVRYDHSEPPGTATGLLGKLDAAQLWSPSPAEQIVLNRGRSPINAPIR